MEEIRRKTLQIDSMSAKDEEMQCVHMIFEWNAQKVEDMVQETSRRQTWAAKNEQEICHVKYDFEALTSYLSSLIIVIETLLSLEKKFQSMEKLFERYPHIAWLN